MLFMTAVYFHDLEEKLAGLGEYSRLGAAAKTWTKLTAGLGLLAALIVNLSIPGQSAPVIEFKVRGAPRRPRASPMSPTDEMGSPVFSRSSSGSSDDAPPLSPTPVRSPGPTVRRLDAVAALEEQAQRVPIIREPVAPIPEGKLHQE
jgi:hypothetical protein